MVHRLQVRDFRCFPILDIQFDPVFTCIVGKNAVGKTSLLEAVSVLVRLQSPRANSLSETIRFGSKGLVADGQVSDYRMQFYYSETRRKLALDGVVQKSSASYLDVARTVYFANSDILLISGSSDARRRFLDFIGSQFIKNYREILRFYEEALRLRNTCLKQFPTKTRELAAYTKTLLRFGHQLTAVRAFLIERLEPLIIDNFSFITDRNECLNVQYRPGATQDFEQALRESAEEEGRFRATVVGPHRDDIEFLLLSRPAQRFASEGQQRTIALAAKLGYAKLLEQEFGKPPILLIDDIFSELDPERRRRLISALPPNAQQLVTTTSLDWLQRSHIGKTYLLREEEHGATILKATR
ncbi:MAG: DNA replication and repair protein RecF [Verrucomicrobia bacterium]|nr:DNA replication and repair protein RecF [Verrucomicrobiota bacterium]